MTQHPDTATAPELSPNAALIGAPDARGRLNTPALVLDMDAFERNLAAMADYAARNNIKIRPHAKSHKSVEIARRQAAAGAVGICCATMGEAEAMVNGGVAGVLITSPVTTKVKIDRLIALAGRAPDAMCVIDDARMTPVLNDAATAAGLTLRLIVDLDVGLDRTGAAPADMVALARAIDAAPALTFEGIQAYAGHHQHIEGVDARTAATDELGRVVSEVRDDLSGAGLPPAIISGGGTGTFDLVTELGVFTELQVGSYPFMDVQYIDVGPRGNAWPFEPALFVAAAVVSANRHNAATTDGGLKAFATDGPPPRVARGAPTDIAYGFMGDEHGRLELGEALPPLEPGHMVECVVPHCDPTVNLHNAYHCVRGEALEAIWPVDARGR